MKYTTHLSHHFFHMDSMTVGGTQQNLLATRRWVIPFSHLLIFRSYMYLLGITWRNDSALNGTLGLFHNVLQNSSLPFSDQRHGPTVEEEGSRPHQYWGGIYTPAYWYVCSMKRDILILSQLLSTLVNISASSSAHWLISQPAPQHTG